MAIPVTIAVVFGLLMASCCHGVMVSTADEERAVNATRELIRRLETENPPRIINPTAKLIRLLFHDCVTGCDGCLDVNNPENNGLGPIYQEVNMLYDSQFNNTGMSRADFIALQAVVAAGVAADEQDCNQLRLPINCTNSEKPRPELFIRYGRKDCATSPNSNNDFGFPDPHRGHAHVMQVFRDGMGMTERQVVALIGAHTLGRTTPQNSGFQGPWAQPQRLDNGFYRSLVNEDWRQNELNFNNAPAGLNPRYQWDNFPRQPPPPPGSPPPPPPPPGSRMMLNTDMALLKNITPNTSGIETNAACKANFTSCTESRTADIVRQYAMNNTRWHRDFGRAFQILLEHGYADNHLVAAGMELPMLVDPTVNTPQITPEPTMMTPVTTPAATPAAVLQEDENRAIEATRQLIQRLEADNPPRIRNPSAKLVRLLFHDCVTGCDGCLDLGNPENNGLSEIYQEVNTLYNSQFSNTGMSRADFIALQAVVAIRVAADEPDCMQLQLPPGCNNTDKPKPTMFIRYGRRDCATSPNSTNDFGFPDAHRGHAHVMQVFRDGMGMTERQVVALIGAHTLGRTTPQNSGFQGPWAPPEDHFDNGFYRSLVNENWRQHELNRNEAPAGFNPRYQWDNFMRTNQPPPRGSRMMLNTDMALLKNITPDANGRETNDSCRGDFTSCPDSRTANIVRQYAMNNTRWHEDFGPAFQILMEHGYPDNYLIAAVTAPATSPTPSVRPTTDMGTPDSALATQ